MRLDHAFDQGQRGGQHDLGGTERLPDRGSFDPLRGDQRFQDLLRSHQPAGLRQFASRPP